MKNVVHFFFYTTTWVMDGESKSPPVTAHSLKRLPSVIKAVNRLLIKTFKTKGFSEISKLFLPNAIMWINMQTKVKNSYGIKEKVHWKEWQPFLQTQSMLKQIVTNVH